MADDARRRRPAARKPTPAPAPVENDETAPATAPRLDRVIHERLRLAIVSALAVEQTLTFRDLQAIVETSDGNLSVHCRRLEEVGYVKVKKSFADRIPRTEYELTTEGRRALERYLSHMEGIIRSVRRRAD